MRQVVVECQGVSGLGNGSVAKCCVFTNGNRGASVPRCCGVRAEPVHGSVISLSEGGWGVCSFRFFMGVLQGFAV
jgi:hypothetical protein